MRDIFEYRDNFTKYNLVKSVLQYGDTASCPKPKISVIMPVYGNPKFFVHSFNSVIHQDADFSYEVIVVDNTPLNDTKTDVLKIIENANIPYVFYYRNKENIGMTGNWNRGIELARAELITFCHDDDMLYPQCLSTLLKLHNKYPNKWIIPACRVIDESISYPLDNTAFFNFRGKECLTFDKIDIFMGNPTNGVGCLFYKKHMLEFGGYNEDYYPSQDNALHIKYVFQKGAVQYRNKLYCYRITKTNESNTVYKKFITNGLFYCKCMTPFMGYPSFVTKLLMHTYRVNITSTMELVWARKGSPSLKPTMMDVIINKCLEYRKTLKKLGFI